ncbi:MAG: hypothetical protein WAM14_06855 [Candidatus Nitrosopolaris sp.]
MGYLIFDIDQLSGSAGGLIPTHKDVAMDSYDHHSDFREIKNNIL